MATAFVTGATSGIGRAIAATLAVSGYDVHAVGRNVAALNELCEAYPSIRPVAVELTDRDALRDAVAHLEIDILVNNAGVMPPLGNFTEMDLADIDVVLDVNLRSVLFLTRLIAPDMRRRGSGHILFVGSSAGHAPAADVAVYAATKAAIAAFTAGLRADLTSFGVRTSEIVPGRVETGLYRTILADDLRAAMYEGDLALQPQDVADMVLATLRLPERAAVTRFDIMPTRPIAPLRRSSAP